MLETILKNQKFVSLMREHCFEVLQFLQEEKIEIFHSGKYAIC